MRSRLLHLRMFALASLAALALGSVARAEDLSIRLSDARESGIFTVGVGQAVVNRVTEPKDLEGALKLDYTLPVGTAAGAYAKAFPPGFDADHLDLARILVQRAGSERNSGVTVSLQIKGSAGIQTIPLDLEGPEISRSEHPIEWTRIGNLTEVVVAIGQTGDAPALGSFIIDVRFEPLPWIRKLADSQAGRFGFAGLLALVLGLIALISRQFVGGGKPAGFQRAGLARDLVQGVGTALIGVVSLWIFEQGARRGTSPLTDVALIVVAGPGLLSLWKLGLTGRWLSPIETVIDTLAIGILVAAASPLEILQAPRNGTEVFQLSQTAASVAAFVYLAFAATRLATTGRHPGAITAALIVGTPFTVGSLVLLSSPAMMQGLGGGDLGTGPLLSGVLGRLIVLFAFNVIVAQALSLATKRTLIRSFRLHVLLLVIADVAVVAPVLADFGSGQMVSMMGGWWRFLIPLVATMFSQAGLWGEVYLVTGLLLDAIHGGAPTPSSTYKTWFLGVTKGAVYSGTFMGLLYSLDALGKFAVIPRLVESVPWLVAIVFCTLAFPLVKTIFETFDGSQRFYPRVFRAYKDPCLYARGAVVGLALGTSLALGLPGLAIASRAWFGFGFGLAAYAGINVLADVFETSRGRGEVQSWKVYFVQGFLGGFIGAAIAFYFDAAQVAVVVAKFHEYLAIGTAPKDFDVRPFLSRWGYINLGTQTGGAKLLFDEALAGTIEWAVPAWLFALNATFMTAFFRKEAAPIRSLFSRDGMTALTQNMIMVFRWGLWMSPIVKSFLRPMGDPTWYNQDGAIRTVFAIYQDATLSPDAFRAWSLEVFISLLAFDAIRILIWMDHMGLRVATLVNLSFMGMDRLDRGIARFVAPAATARFIPEGVKRFTTWAPLLIPFYIPKGAEWNIAWTRHEEIQKANGGGTLLAPIEAMSSGQQVFWVVVALVVFTLMFALIRLVKSRRIAKAPAAWSIANTDYEIALTSTGEVRSQTRGYDVTRRSYDLLDPAGRALFLVDTSSQQSWPVVGNFPVEAAAAPPLERLDDGFRIRSEKSGIKTSVEIRTAGPRDPAEVWEITVENLTDSTRTLKIVPYLEWVLNKPDADRGHTQYNRLFAEMEYAQGLHAVLAWDKHAKAMGLLASDLIPEGFLTARVDFIGRARSLWDARALETLAFSEHQDTDAHPTFDPIGALLVGLTIPPRESRKVRLLIGMVSDKKTAIELIARHLRIPHAEAHPIERRRKTVHSIRHGEIPPGTPQPYHEFSENGQNLRVLTPFTPRPYDHALSNAMGHLILLTNRGLHTSASVNSQQNRVTPDWPDTVTREVPSEAFYLFDIDTNEWFSPTYHPTNDREASHLADFSVDGTAIYTMTKGPIETELTVFVPPDEPVGIYLLTVRNHSSEARRFRVAPYFQIVLASQPEAAGPLEIRHDPMLRALFFTNPRNTFRTGPAFAAISRIPERIETNRGQFFGQARNVARPSFVERGEPRTDSTDDRPVAAFLTTIEVHPGSETTLLTLLGQADDREQAESVIRKYPDVRSALVSLEETRTWWRRMMDTVHVGTASRAFDRYLDWLMYQALAERIWARRGFYQSSGAFGFRDQLQDAVNLIWMDPALARKQILLHGSQQFPEGDVVHWFHRLQDGRTGFVARTHASDNLLWLAWGVVEYVGATGDESLLDERTPYLESELPFPPLPANKDGMGFDPLRSSRDDTVYRHAMKAIDRVLDRKMGAHGLPLMGTGDWNDGLDEIGAKGRGESVWLGFFLYYILERMAPIVGKKEGDARQDHYLGKLRELAEALESTWRDDRYLRAIHDDGTEIGVKGSGVWEIDALTAAWAVMAGINPGRGRIVFETALEVLEKETTILLGWPSLSEDTKPYLGRSSAYPEGVRENGMYCHGVQWLVGAARLLSNQAAEDGRPDDAARYREDAYRLWRKISALPHVEPDQVETYGGQPNKQAADMVTTFDPGRMIWHGYTGAAGWMFRQAIEGVLGYRLIDGTIQTPGREAIPSELDEAQIWRDVAESPLPQPETLQVSTPKNGAWSATGDSRENSKI